MAGKSGRAGNQNRRRAGQRRSGGRSGGFRTRQSGGPRGPRPLPSGDSFATPDPSPVRAAVERRSAALLVYLHRLPRWVVFAALLVLVAAAVIAKGVVGGLLLVAVAALLGWLAFVSWPTLRGGERAFRVLVVLVVLAGAGYFLTPS